MEGGGNARVSELNATTGPRIFTQGLCQKQPPVHQDKASARSDAPRAGKTRGADTKGRPMLSYMLRHEKHQVPWRYNTSK